MASLWSVCGQSVCGQSVYVKVCQGSVTEEGQITNQIKPFHPDVQRVTSQESRDIEPILG